MAETGAVEDSDYPYESGTSGATGYCDKSVTVKPHYKCQSTTLHGYTTDDTIKEALHDGPLETRFNVYRDFMSYKGGVYKHTTGSLAGGHAVKMIGYGT